MTLPEIKKMILQRALSLVFTVVFITLVIVSSIGMRMAHWSQTGFFLIALACVILAPISFSRFSFLNKKLAKIGL
jgi:hypothetical protein